MRELHRDDVGVAKPFLGGEGHHRQRGGMFGAGHVEEVRLPPRRQGTAIVRPVFRPLRHCFHFPPHRLGFAAEPYSVSMAPEVRKARCLRYVMCS
ncbi:hypothetical protein D3C71_1797220 [compost metagenome]